MGSDLRVPGAILAGGASRRFGSPKALASVGGRRVIERVRDTLRAAGAEPWLITNQPDLFADLRVPSHPDMIAAAGPLAGIHAALHWAAEEERPGVVCVACDMPFISPGLIRALLSRDARQIIVPESTSRRGIEPLCAFYPVSYLPQIESRLASEDHRLVDLLHSVPVDRLPLAEVRHWGDPERIFFNVNTPDDYQRATELADA